MKERAKLYSWLLSVALIIGILPMGAYATSANLSAITHDEVQFMESYISQDSGETVSAKQVRFLVNSSGEEVYLACTFEKGGYAIFYRPTMTFSEYTLDGDIPFNWDADIVVYGGPTNYLEISDKTLAAEASIINHALSNEEMQCLVDAENAFVAYAQESFQQNRLAKANSYQVSHTITINGKSGQSLMSPYNYSSSSKLLNDASAQEKYKDGICGLANSSALLAFYEQHVRPSSAAYHYVTPSLITSDGKTLINYLYPYILKGTAAIGTVGPEVAIGLNKYFEEKGLNYTPGVSATCAVGASTITNNALVSKVGSDRPAMVGVITAFGAPWNHWMIAYAYSGTMTVGDTVIYNNMTVTALQMNGTTSNYKFNAGWISAVLTLNK